MPRLNQHRSYGTGRRRVVAKPQNVAVERLEPREMLSVSPGTLPAESGDEGVANDGDRPQSLYFFRDPHDVIVIPENILTRCPVVPWPRSPGGGIGGAILVTSTVDWSTVDWSAIDWSTIDWSTPDWSTIYLGDIDWSATDLGAIDLSAVDYGVIDWSTIDWDTMENNLGAIDWSAIDLGGIDWSAIDLDANDWRAINLGFIERSWLESAVFSAIDAEPSDSTARAFADAGLSTAVEMAVPTLRSLPAEYFAAFAGLVSPVSETAGVASFGAKRRSR